jgi:hypothetical protein
MYVFLYETNEKARALNFNPRGFSLEIFPAMKDSHANFERKTPESVEKH